jgi:Spy/CpxP family protein refolding chaperone
MNSLPNLRPQRWLLLALFAFLPLAASAQERPDRAERLQQALDLTDEQAALVEEVLGDEVERGDLWDVTVALTPTLTDAQKEKLFARPERPMRRSEDGPRGRRGERGLRGERLQRPDIESRTERREERFDGMADALDLTDAQRQQLEALRAERQAEMEARRAEREQLREEMQQLRAERPGPGGLPDEVAAVLTPEQQEIAKVHRALAAHAMHRLHHHRRGLRR